MCRTKFFGSGPDSLFFGCRGSITDKFDVVLVLNPRNLLPSVSQQHLANN